MYTRPSTPAGEGPQWSVWDMTSGKGRRVELEPWAMVCSLFESPAWIHSVRQRARNEHRAGVSHVPEETSVIVAPLRRS